MAVRRLMWLIVLAGIGLPCVAAGQTAPAETPRTPWGDPDLQGFWNNNSAAPLERPENLGERATLTAEEVEQRFERRRNLLFGRREGDTGSYNEFWFEHGQDNNRASLIVDPPNGRMPLTPDAQQHYRAGLGRLFQAMRGPASHLDLSLWDRCITRSMPGAMIPSSYNANYQILQAPGYVALLVEMIHDVRIIPLDGRDRPPQAVRQWLGNSRGRWDGDTLVVETTHFTAKGRQRGIGRTVFGVGANLRLTERFTHTGEDAIDYSFTVEDDSMFTRPWTAAIPMNRVAGPLFEYACHEGNYAMPNMLRGARR